MIISCIKTFKYIEQTMLIFFSLKTSQFRQYKRILNLKFIFKKHKNHDLVPNSKTFKVLIFQEWL